MSKKIVDYETGEIIDNVQRIVTESEEKKISDYRAYIQRRQQLYQLMSKHCGNFYFYRYDKLLEQLGDDTATAFRFLYLCSCADQDGYFVKYKNEYCKSKEDFTYVFEKTKDTVTSYLNKLISNKLLYKDAKGYRLNPMYYSMGNMDDEFKRSSIRTFNNAIKELYRNSDPREHKMIGKILKLVPYINIYNNVLCWDIEETDKDLIQPLTAEDIRYVIYPDSNYGYDVMDKLGMLFVKGEPLLGKFTSVDQTQYIINPRVFYRGNNVADLKAVIDQFDIAKHQYIRKKKKMLRNKKDTNVI